MNTASSVLSFSNALLAAFSILLLPMAVDTGTRTTSFAVSGFKPFSNNLRFLSFTTSDISWIKTRPFVGSSFAFFDVPHLFLYSSGIVIGFALYGGFIM